jgi:hypothetical protein
MQRQEIHNLRKNQFADEHWKSPGSKKPEYSKIRVQVGDTPKTLFFNYLSALCAGLKSKLPDSSGETYHFTGIGENGLVGTVTTATVNEAGKEMIIAVATNGEGTHMLRQPMSDEALSDYKAHPEAFFGVVQHIGKNIQDHYELFLFFYNSHQNVSKEKLLEFMRGAPDIAALQEMGQEDLALEYAERMVAMHIHSFPKAS